MDGSPVNNNENKHTMSKKIIAIATVLMYLTVMAQPQSNWTTFDIKNSDITGNTILALATDSKNNKWVGTSEGLCRLSGKTWTDYAMFNDKLKGQFVNCLSVDKQGTLWIGTDDYGVIEFDGRNFSEHSAETRRLNMKFIRCITIDKQDVKWFGVTLGGVVRYDGREWTKYTAAESGLLSDFVLCITIDRRGRKWIGTNDGLCLFDDNRWIGYTTKNSDLPDNIVPAIAIDKDDVKWLGTLAGLCRYDGNTWTTYNTSNSPMPGNQVNALSFDQSGALWIATDNGVAVFDGNDHWVTYTTANSRFPAKNVQSLVIDNQGNKWFGTDFQGLVRFSACGISGTVTDESGNPMADVKLTCGNYSATTDKDGAYILEIPAGTATVLRIDDASANATPASRDMTQLRGFAFGQDFTVSLAAAEGTGTERVVVNPYLDKGYITITLESPKAEIEFIDASGTSIRKIPEYLNGNRITISRMPKGMYTVKIKTVKGEKSLKFNLR